MVGPALGVIMGIKLHTVGPLRELRGSEKFNNTLPHFTSSSQRSLALELAGRAVEGGCDSESKG